MDELKPNSHRFKEAQQLADTAEKKVEKVVSGPVKSRKRSIFQDVAGEFLSKDVSNIRNYVLGDVLIPAIKKAVDDIVTNGIKMMLYGETGRKKGSTYASSVSYRGYYDKQREQDEPVGQRVVNGYRYDDITFATRGDAESVLMRMDELIDVYGSASVADFYDLAGVTGNYTDNKYGWIDLQSATAIRMRDGYIIKFPKVMPLN